MIGFFFLRCRLKDHPISGLGGAYKKNAPRKKGLSGRQAEWQGNYIKPKNSTAVLAFYYLVEELSSLILR